MKRINKIILSETGYSLMDLVIAIVLVGITASVAVPSYLDYLPRLRLRSAASDLVSNLQQVRVQALKTSSKWAVQFDISGKGEYRILNDDGGDGNWNNGNETVFKTVSLLSYPDIVFGSGYGKRPGATSNPNDGISYTANRVLFNPDGTSKSGTIYLKNTQNDTFAIGSLSFTGRIQTWHNYGGSWE